MSPEVASGAITQPSRAGMPAPAVSLLDQAKNWGGGHKALLALLGSGALGGTLGGILSSRTPADPEETPAQRRRRIIMNVLGGGAAGVGITGAGMLGAQYMNKAVTEGGPGVVGGAMNYAKSTLGRGINAVTGGAVGASGAGKLQQRSLSKQLFSKEIPAEWQTPKGQGQTGLGRGKFTPETLSAGFENPGATIAAPAGRVLPTLTRQTAIQDAIAQAMGHKSPEDTQAFIRGLGHTPAGESGLGAAFRRNLAPHGTPSTSLFRAGKAGINPRLLGGVGGAVTGALLPEIISGVGSTIGRLANPAGDVNQPGS